jgi:arylsulfatase A-like enzyme
MPMPDPFMSRPRPYLELLVVLAAFAWACTADPTSELRIDLAGAAVCAIGGEFAAPPVEEGPRHRALVQADARPIDFFLPLPPGAALAFELSGELSAELFALSVATDERSQTLSPARVRKGAWRAEIPGFAGEVVRLRLENRTGAALHWIEPRLLGERVLEAPLLPRPPERESGPYNVLLYVIDTLRADHLSLYGYERATSPRLQELARRSTVFESAYSSSNNTMNAIPTLFTSLYSSRARGRLREQSPDPIEKTLAEAFREAGFATAGFQANYTMTEGLGFGRGFDDYGVYVDKEGRDIRSFHARKLHRSVNTWLDARPERPFFLYVQSMDAHSPYSPPRPFRGRYSDDANPPQPELTYEAESLDPRFSKWFPDLIRTLRPDRYDEVVAYADHELGRLLDNLEERGLRESTIVVVTSDHGEALGEGGRYLHSVSLHEEQVHIPLIISAPGQSEARREREVVSLIDVAPTLLDLAGAPIPEHFEGRSLLQPSELHEHDVAIGEYLHTTGDTAQWFARQGAWKLLADRRSVQLFHLPSDPTEAKDLASNLPILRDYLASVVWERSAPFRDEGYEAPALRAELSDEEAQELDEALRALGYIE